MGWSDVVAAKNWTTPLKFMQMLGNGLPEKFIIFLNKFEDHVLEEWGGGTDPYFPLGSPLILWNNNNKNLHMILQVNFISKNVSAIKEGPAKYIFRVAYPKRFRDRQCWNMSMVHIVQRSQSLYL